MTNLNTEEVDLEMAERQELVEKYDALQVLTNEHSEAGKAFKKLVLDGYLKDKAVEFTSLLAVPGMQTSRSQLFEALAAISHFENYLSMISNLGAPANEDDELEG
jgi:hypothetical protein